MKGTGPIRERLVALLEEIDPDPAFRPGNGESLIRSGRIDSMGLFRLALWIEEETRSRLDLSILDPSTEWDTVEGILDFVSRHGAPG